MMPKRSHPLRSRGVRRALAPAAGTAAIALTMGLLIPTAEASPAAADQDASPSPSADATPEALPEIPIFHQPDADCAESSFTVADPPWTTVSTGLEEAHTFTRGDGTTVAVLATGLSADNPALEDAVTSGGGGQDCQGYGSFLAGIVAARPVQDSGFTGVAPEAEVIGVATGDVETGTATPGDVASSISDAADAGADVILVSAAAWESSEALEDAVADATEADALVVAPALVTLQRESESHPGYPAQDSSVLSVGSFDPEGAAVVASPPPLEPGSAEFARTDVIAPGVSVMGVGPDGGHYVSSGDGVAAAFAAGAAALLRSHEPDLSAEGIRDRLMATASGAIPGAEADAVGRGPIDPVGALTNDPRTGEESEGAEFTATPPYAGSWNQPVTVSVVGVSALLILGCALGAVVLRRGRARRWRPAAAGEKISPDRDAEPG